jgi:uncharacterized integral membrane protein
MKEEFNEYKDLIQLMEAAPKVKFPDGLTEEIMNRLPELNQGIFSKARRTIFNPVVNSIYSGLAQKLSVSSPRECSFCFFMTGFFYLVMGIILLIGFKAISTNMAATEWIALQPHLTLGVAIWLLALGGVLMMDGSAAIKMAKYGTLFYIFFTVFNGILMRPYLHFPYAGIFTTGFVGTGVLIGVMLVLAVNKMELRPV